MLAGLRSDLRRDAQGHFLQIGPVRVPVEVEDAPFVVVRAERDGDRLVMALNDLTRDALAPETLRFGEDGTPYCRVKDGAFEARWSRAATYQLLQHVESDEPGETANPPPGRPTLSAARASARGSVRAALLEHCRLKGPCASS